MGEGKGGVRGGSGGKKGAVVTRLTNAQCWQVWLLQYRRLKQLA